MEICALNSNRAGRRFAGAAAMAAIIATGWADAASARPCQPTLYVKNQLNESVKVARVEIRALGPGWDKLVVVDQTYMDNKRCALVAHYGKGPQKVERCTRKKKVVFPAATHRTVGAMQTAGRVQYPAGSRVDVTVHYDRLVKDGRRWGNRKSAHADGGVCSGATDLFVTLR